MCLGIPGKVVDIWDDAGTRMSTVDFGGTTKTVCLAYLPDMEIGEYTIVHAGFAITRLDEESANETLKMFADLGVLDAELAGDQAADQEGSGMKYLDEFRDPVAARRWSTRSNAGPPGPGRSWKSAVDRHIRSSATASTSCSATRSSSSTDPAARSA